MFDQTFITNSGKRRPWTYAIGLAGELLAIGFLMLLPLIYTEQLPAFGLSQLKIVAPHRLQPKPPDDRTVSRKQVAFRTIASASGFYAPRLDRLRAVNLESDQIDAPSGMEVPGALYDPAAIHSGMPDAARMAFTPKPPEPVAHVEPAPRKPDPPTVRVQVGGDVQAARIIRKVIPIYPPLARQARVQGVVKLSSVIGADGTIQQLQVLSGHPLLAPAAVEAVRQWVYRPTLLNGRPVEVSAPIDVNFTLAQ